jgi:biopolymer transport protein ExbD
MRWARIARAREEPRADMTPMIDVVFQLLIFFLCTLQYRTLEGRLNLFLPEDVGRATRAAADIEPLRIAIRVEARGERRDPRDLARPWSCVGRYELVGRTLSFRVGPRAAADLGGVRALLTELHARDPRYRVLLEPGPGTLQGDVVAVLDEVVGAGFDQVVVAAAR